ncbi:hypothetical protein AX14_012218 [Amanita brunnescens Koide BX004]|nr:hypothetical protein AX14_012218 [Amanita brunnescens Koide BX004]
MLNIATRSLFNATRSASIAGRSSLNYVSRSVVTLKDVKYTANATASGQGRNGQVESNGLKLNLASPKEMGGSGKGENPEQLFAMGYAGCLLGALQLVARQQGKKEMAERAVVHTSVSIGTPNELPGFGIAVDIKVEGVDDEVLRAGHEFCPYSRALTRGAVVNISKA